MGHRRLWTQLKETSVVNVDELQEMVGSYRKKKHDDALTMPLDEWADTYEPHLATGVSSAESKPEIMDTTLATAEQDKNKEASKESKEARSIQPPAKPSKKRRSGSEGWQKQAWQACLATPAEARRNVQAYRMRMQQTLLSQRATQEANRWYQEFFKVCQMEPRLDHPFPGTRRQCTDPYRLGSKSRRRRHSS